MILGIRKAMGSETMIYNDHDHWKSMGDFPLRTVFFSTPRHGHEDFRIFIMNMATHSGGFFLKMTESQYSIPIRIG